MSESNTGSAAPVESAPAIAESESPEISAQTGGEGIPASAEAEVQEALENGDVKEAQRLVKKYQLKVRGKTVEREVDLSDDDFIKNQLQLAEISKISMQEAAELKKAYQKEMERFKQNPWEVLQDLGFDPDELAEMRIQQRIEEMKKSPEQLEREQIQAELKAAREEAARLKEEKEAIEMSKLQEQAAIAINDEISKALSAHKTLPSSPYVVKRVADSMLWAMNNGFEDVTADDVVPLVEQEMRSELGKLYDEMPEEALEQFIGKKNIDRLRKKRVAAVKVPSVNDVKPTTQSLKAAADQKAEAKKIAQKDFFRNLGKK